MSMIQKYSFLCGFTFFIFGMVVSFAQEDFLQSAKNSFKKGNFRDSLKNFKEANAFPNLEEAESLYYLGRIYSEGLGGIPVQLKKGYGFYEKSAHKDYDPAKTKLALYFLSGEIVNQNLKKTVRLLKDTAKQNDIEAQLVLDSLYFDNYITEKDLEKHPDKDNWEKRRKTQNQKNKDCFQVFSIELEGNNLIKTKRFKKIFLKYLFRCIHNGDIVLLFAKIISTYENQGYVARITEKTEIDYKTGKITLKIVENKIFYSSENFKVVKKKDIGSEEIDSFQKCEGVKDNIGIKKVFPKYKKDKEIFWDFDILGHGLKNIDGSMKVFSPNEKGVRKICIVLNKKKAFFLNISSNYLGKNSSYGDFNLNNNLNVKNILNLNETIDLSYGETIENSSDTHNQSDSFKFSLPLGYWTYSYSYLGSRYSLKTQTGAQEFISRGDSISRTFSLKRVLHKRKQNEWTAKLNASINENRTFIDDTLVDVSSRRLAVANWSLIRNWKSWTITSSYKHGFKYPGAREDTADIQENEPHAQFNLYSISVAYNPYLSKKWKYSGRIFYQQPDREVFATVGIGGSGSVRGYKNNSYSDDIGGFMQNAFSTNFNLSRSTALQFTTFYDYGCVESAFGNNNYRCLSGGGISASFFWKNYVSLFYSYEIPDYSTESFTTEEPIVRRFSLSFSYPF